MSNVKSPAANIASRRYAILYSSTLPKHARLDLFDKRRQLQCSASGAGYTPSGVAARSTQRSPDEMKECVNKQINEENLRPMFEMVFNGKEEQATQGLIKKMTACETGSAG